MARTFYRKKFSNYLGEQRAIDDIVLIFTADIQPTPSPTPSNTPTPSITPSPTATPIISVTSTPTPTQTNTPTSTLPITPTTTSTGTPTPTPTGTPNPLCPQQLILSASTSGYLYGLYTRATIFTGGTFETAWYNFDDNVMNYGTNPDGNDYVAFQINSGSDYTSLYWSSDIMGNGGNWTLGYSTGNTLFNGGTLISSIILDTNSIIDGILFFPPSGFLQYNGGYINYPVSCPTPTPTASSTPTPTPESPTPTPTPTLTPTPTEPAGYKLQAENSSFIQTEDGDNIEVEYGSTPGFDVDAEAYLNAVLSNGGTLSPTISAATDTLFVQLKSNGLYSKIDAMYPVLGGTAASNKFNAINPLDTDAAYRLTFTAGWTHSSSGMTTDGSPATYADTYYDASLVVSGPADQSISIYSTTGGGSPQHIGSTDTTAGVIEVGIYTDFGCSFIPNVKDAASGYVFYPQGTSCGIGYFITTSTGTNVLGSKNGSVVVNSPQIPAFTNKTGYIGNSNGNLTGGSPLNVIFAHFGRQLSSGEMTTLSTIINTFQTTLGRNTY